MTLIAVKQVTKQYGSQKAVDDISFTLDRGEIVGFLGPNGAGKSTTMKMISGILSADSGEILVDDQPMNHDHIALRQKIAYLPEQNPLYNDLYIRESLEFIAKLHRVEHPTPRILDIMSLTGLNPEKNKKIGELSKGYRQRVGLAQTILHQPDLYILDEATTGLDPNQILEIRELIKSLGKEKAILISTHILQEVESICQRCILINKGKIMADERMDVFKSRASGLPQIRVKFKNKVNIHDIKAHWKNVESIHDGFIITHYDQDLGASIFQWAVQHGVVITELTPLHHTLEDIFQSLTISNN